MVERAVASQEDMAVVGRTTTLDELVELARATKPDVVVAGFHDSRLPPTYLELLLERPRVKVLGLHEHEGQAWLYELRPDQIEIGEVSPDEVVHTIREAAQRQSLR
jgi:DNA-binding NarL/FixJ family response regulator